MDFLDELRIEHGDCDPDECETKMLLDVLAMMEHSCAVSRTAMMDARDWMTTSLDTEDYMQVVRQLEIAIQSSDWMTNPAAMGE